MTNVRGAALCFLLTAGCLPAASSLGLRADARLHGGTETVATISVPGSWHQSTKGTERAEVTAPDNFSQVIFTLTPVDSNRPGSCREFAHRAVGDGIAGVTERQVRATPGVADSIDYRLVVPGPTPGPSERVVLGRASCRDGGLVNLTCSTGHLKRETLALCEKVIASLDLHGVVQNPIEPIVPADQPVVPGVDMTPPAPPLPPAPSPSESH